MIMVSTEHATIRVVNRRYSCNINTPKEKTMQKTMMILTLYLQLQQQEDEDGRGPSSHGDGRAMTTHCGRLPAATDRPWSGLPGR